MSGTKPQFSTSASRTSLRPRCCARKKPWTCLVQRPMKGCWSCLVSFLHLPVDQCSAIQKNISSRTVPFWLNWINVPGPGLQDTWCLSAKARLTAGLYQTQVSWVQVSAVHFRCLPIFPPTREIKSSLFCTFPIIYFDHEVQIDFLMNRKYPMKDNKVQLLCYL